jgi:hypothetical protein
MGLARHLCPGYFVFREISQAWQNPLRETAGRRGSGLHDRHVAKLREDMQRPGALRRPEIEIPHVPGVQNTRSIAAATVKAVFAVGALASAATSRAFRCA